MSKKISILEPERYSAFYCVGSKCIYTCCQGWNISVDDITYKKYMTGIKNNNLRKKIKNSIKICDGEKIFKLNKEKKCPLIRADGLCEIHSELGEEFLCGTCRFYPRIYNIVDGCIERSLVSSCPAVIEKVIFNEEKMGFSKYDIDINICDFNNVSLNLNTNIQKDLNYFWNVRTLSISIMQSRDYLIEERIVILGILLNKINQMIIKKDFFSIDKFISNFECTIKTIDIKQFMNTIESKDEFKLGILELFFNIDSPIAKEVLDTTRKNMSFGNMKKTVGEYNHINNNQYNKFINKYSYIIENYLVNYMFSNLFPYDKKNMIFDKYIIFVTQYILLKFNLIGSDDAKREIDKDTILKILPRLVRLNEHNDLYLANILLFFKKNNLDNLAAMIALIK